MILWLKVPFRAQIPVSTQCSWNAGVSKHLHRQSPPLQGCGSFVTPTKTRALSRRQSQVALEVPTRKLRGIMTVGARLRSKASSLVGRGPLGRLRRAGDEETDAIVEHLEGEDEDPESQDCEREEDGRRAGTPSARRVHLAALPERYDSLEEPAPGDKPKKRYRRKLKKYGKNVGKAISKGCRYIVIGLQGFAAAYTAPFGVATSVVSFVR